MEFGSGRRIWRGEISVEVRVAPSGCASLPVPETRGSVARPPGDVRYRNSSGMLDVSLQSFAADTVGACDMRRQHKSLGSLRAAVSVQASCSWRGMLLGGRIVQNLKPVVKGLVVLILITLVTLVAGAVAAEYGLTVRG